MKLFLRILGIFFVWTGVAVIAETWVITSPSIFGLYKHWQLYVAVLLFFIAQKLFERVGKID